MTIGRPRREDRAQPRLDWPDLLEISDLLSNASILEVLAEGRDFLCVFAVTGMTEFLGTEITGYKISQLPVRAKFTERSGFIFNRVVRTGLPVVDQVSMTFLEERNYLTLESVSLPLFGGQDQVTHVMVRIETKPAAGARSGKVDAGFPE